MSKDNYIYLIDEDLYNDELINNIIKEGNDKKLSICYNSYIAGVAYINGEYISYLTNERAAFERYQKHQTLQEAITSARQYDQALIFELNYCNKQKQK